MWAALFNFAGGGLVHMNLFEIGETSMAGPTLLEWIAGTILLSGTAAARPAATAVPIGTEYYATDTAARWKSDGSTWIANSGSAGAAVIAAASVTLTNAQVLALPSTPIQTLAAPGAGLIRIPILAVVNLNWTADYTNIDGACELFFDVAGPEPTNLPEMLETNGAISDLLAGGMNRIAWFGQKQRADANNTSAKSPLDTTAWTNAVTRISSWNNAAGDFTGGNAANTLKVTTLYYDLTP